MELSPLATVGWGAVVVVVACWLTVSFAAPGAARTRAGWVGACAMYVAFVCLFGSIFLRTRANDNMWGMLGAGFLLVFFSVGFVLAALRAVRALAGKQAGKVESATH